MITARKLNLYIQLKTKGTSFNGTHDLKMRITEASNEIRPFTLRNISQYSGNMFDIDVYEWSLSNKPYRFFLTFDVYC